MKWHGAKRIHRLYLLCLRVLQPERHEESTKTHMMKWQGAKLIHMIWVETQFEIYAEGVG